MAVVWKDAAKGRTLGAVEVDISRQSRDEEWDLKRSCEFALPGTRPQRVQCTLMFTPVQEPVPQSQVRWHIIGNARIKIVGKSQSCMCSQAVDVSGQWRVTVCSTGFELYSRLHLTQDGAMNVQARENGQAAGQGVVVRQLGGNALLKLSIPQQGGRGEVASWEGVVSEAGETIQGTVTGGQVGKSSARFEASKEMHSLRSVIKRASRKMESPKQRWTTYTTQVRVQLVGHL